MNFIPEQPKESISVPYFDDVTKEAGWQGQSTTKSIKTLQAEIIEAISRLGGLVINFQRGSFQSEAGNRDGFRVHYVVQAADGRQVPGRIDIAALPIKTDWSLRRSEDKRKDQSLKMALYMLRMALDGTWFLQQLSPGYSALVPFMLGSGSDKTISELWAESSVMNNLLPPGEEEFINGEVREIR
jgi:hypothetical protein